MRLRLPLLVAGLACAPLLSGCTYMRYQTETPRSATEQLLVSEAIERAVARLELPDLGGHRVAVETIALNTADAPYLRSALEARASAAGAALTPRDDADVILVVRAGALGTASRDAMFGVPPLPIPGGMATPALAIARAVKQRGYAGLRLVALDDTGERIGASGPVLGRASFEVYGFLFLVLRRNDIYPGERFSGGVD